MAMFDRIRGRKPAEEQQQNPLMGTGSIGGRPAIMPGMGGGSMQQTGGMPAMQQEPDDGRIDRIMAGNNPDEQDAMREDRRSAAENMLMASGMGTMRIKELQNESRIMNPQRLRKATETLKKYEAGKKSVNRRVEEAQNWWKLNNWEEQEKKRGTRGAARFKSNTGWLWNCIVGKHADAIDSYPEPIILPRAEDDKEEAKKLSKIVPVVMEINGFEGIYNSASWQKMREGTGVYGIFWDPDKCNGLGDVSIKNNNILNLVWEPGIEDIQDSRNVFYKHWEDTESLVQQHPELAGVVTGTNAISMDEYKTDDHIDHSGQTVVIDWYYKKKNNGRTELHYCQYVHETALFSTEENGEPLYNHAQYPFVLDTLFPVAGSCAGYGYIDIGKDAQMDIDTISQAMVKNAEAASTPRFFIRKDGGINEDEFADFSKPFVHSNGMLGQDSIRAVEVKEIGSNAMNMLQQKIDELKFITGNTDINNGGVPSGVTAASAIAALKEDSGRSSKDSTKAAYRAYTKIVNMVIELIRQFYSIPRQFRIVGQDGTEEFTQYDNSGIVAQPIPNGGMAEDEMRLPVFDIEVRAQRENAYTKMSQNELAIQMYQLGVFNPQMTDQALQMIDMMDFRGKDELRQRIEQNGTIQDTLAQVSQIAMALANKYDPQVAQQLGMTLQGVMGDVGMMPAGGGEINPQLQAPADNMAAPNPNENGIVRKARERAANASRPD